MISSPDVSRLLRYICVVVCLMISGLMTQALYAANVQSTKTGNWNDTTVWSTSSVPGPADNVTIASGHTISMNASSTIAGLTVTGTLQFNNTTTGYMLTFAAGSIISVSGTLDMGVLGVLQTGSSGTTTFTMGSAGTLKTSNLTGAPAGALGPGAGASFQTQGTGIWDLTSLDTNGTVNYAGIGGAAYVVTDRNYYNLTFNGAGNMTWNLAADRTVAGTLLSTSTSITYVGTQNIFIGVNYNSQTTLNPGTSTIVFNGTGSQYINHNGTPFNNIVINKSAGTMTAYYTSTVNGSFTVTAGTFTPGAYAFTIKGAFTNNGTATGLTGWRAMSLVTV